LSRLTTVTRSLVGRQQRVAVAGAAAFVEGHGQVTRRAPLDQVAEETREAVQRLRRIAVAIAQVRRHGVPGAKYVDGRVDQVNHAR